MNWHVSVSMGPGILYQAQAWGCDHLALDDITSDVLHTPPDSLVC